jgi:hypothetical protein
MFAFEIFDDSYLLCFDRSIIYLRQSAIFYNKLEYYVNGLIAYFKIYIGISLGTVIIN